MDFTALILSQMRDAAEVNFQMAVAVRAEIEELKPWQFFKRRKLTAEHNNYLCECEYIIADIHFMKHCAYGD